MRQDAKHRRFAAAVLAAVLTPAIAFATCTRDAMIVFDGSGSMSEVGFNQIDRPRIFDARDAMRTAMPPITPLRRVGLIVYGPGTGDECANIDLRFAPKRNGALEVIGAVDTLQPSGNTPLTEAVERAADVLNAETEPGVIVLVTDGKETCDGAPCQLAAELASSTADLTIHVIGFKVRGDYFSWDSQGATDYREGRTVARCLADRTGGSYFDAETVDELIEALSATLGCNFLSEVIPLRINPAALPNRLPSPGDPSQDAS